MRKVLFIINVLLFLQNGILYSQTLQVTLSPDKSKIDRRTKGGIATIFFDSSIEDLSIICTDENPDESIEMINDNLRYIRIDVKKDIEADGVCYRNFLLKCSASAEYYLTTDEIAPNQVLYYTVTLPNELEPKLLEEKAKKIAKEASVLVDDGDSYLARRILLEVLPPNLPYTQETEMALRKAMQYDNSILVGHTYYVNFASFSTDGKQIVSASTDKTIKIWDTQTGRMQKTITGHNANVNSVLFNKKGDLVLSASGNDVEKDNTVRVWDVFTGECIKTYDGFTSLVHFATFSPDEEMIAGASKDKTVRLWDVKTNACKILRGHSGEVFSVSFSGDGKLLASSSYDRTIRIWDTHTGRCIKTLKGHTGGINSVAFSPNSRKIVSASGYYIQNMDISEMVHDNTIRVWDIATGQCDRILEGHNSDVTFVSYSIDGQKIVSASADKTVRVWGAESGQCLKTISTNEGCVNSAMFSPNGQKIVFTSSFLIHIWDLSPNSFSMESFNDHSSPNSLGSTISVSPKGTYLASASDSTVQIWDVNTLRQLKTLAGQKKKVSSLSFLNNDKIVSSSWDGTICIWNITSGECEKRINNEFTYKKTKEPIGISFVNSSPDGYNLITSNLFYTGITKWNTQTWERDTIETKGCADCLTYSPDGKIIIFSIENDIYMANNKLSVFQLLTGHSRGVNSLSFSPDGKRFVSSSTDNTIRIWDVAKTNCMKTLTGHQNSVNHASFSSDGSKIISASTDRTVKVWDVNTGFCLYTLEEPKSCNAVSFFAGDNRICVSLYDGTIRFWDFPPLPQLIDETRERFKDRQLTSEEKAKYGLE